ncbi:MAG: hypothetical protein ACREMA_06180 [Longimicrobiales bacterium]
MTAGSIDPETIAAFLDGTLSASERDPVTRALISSPELYETFIEARAVRDELNTTREPIKIRTHVVPIRKHRAVRLKRLQVALPIAAVLAGVLVVERVALAPRGPQALRLLEDAAWLAANQQGAPSSLPGNWSRIVWPASRSAASSGVPANAAFRAGVLLVNIEVAAAIGDSANARTAAADLTNVLSNVSGGVPATTLLAAATSSAARRELAQELQNLFADSPWYEFGMWLGQARLAAAANDLSFFAPAGPAAKPLSDVRDRLAENPANQNDANSQAALNHIDALLTMIKAGQPGTAAALSDSLSSILSVAASSREF